MNRYAVVVGGVVENLVLWDGETEWNPGKDATVVPLEDDAPVPIGWTYDGKVFTRPEPEERSDPVEG